MINEELKNFIEQNCSGKEPSDIIMEAIGKKIEQYGADADEVLAFVEKCSKGPTLEKKADIARQEESEARRSADIQNLSNATVQSTHEAASHITDTLNRNAESSAKARKKIILSIIIAIATLGIGYGVFSMFTYYKNKPTSGEFIDLGLPSGTLWCSHDLGAKDYDHESMDTYSIGDPSPRNTPYGFDGTHKGLQYNENEGNWYRIFPENTQGTEYDAAYVATNGEACIPTKAQAEELLRYCEIKRLGRGECLFIGPNGNKIKVTDIYLISDIVPNSFCSYYTFTEDGVDQWHGDDGTFLNYKIRPVKNKQ